MIKKLQRRMTLLVVAVILLVSTGIVISINYMNWRNISSQAQDALNTLANNSGSRPSLIPKGEMEQEPPEKPEGEIGQDLPEKPEGEIGQDLPEKPEGEIGQDLPEKPEGEMGQEPPEKPEGEMGQEPPEKPGEETSQEPFGKARAEQEEGEEPSSVNTGGSQGRDEGGRRPRLSSGQPLDLENALASLSNYYVINLSLEDEIKDWTSDRADLYTDDQIEDFTTTVLETGKESGRIGTQFFRLVSGQKEKMLIVLDQRLEMISARRVLKMTALIAALAGLILCIGAWFFIRAMVRPVQDAFDRQRQFVWDASHELKTPLAVIGANADALEGEVGRHENLSYIRSEVKRTDKLVQNLLTLARMDQGTRVAKPEELDLGKLVQGVTLPFESTAFEENKELILSAPEGIACKGDREMLQQLVVILLGNAMKYTPPGGRIEVLVKEKGKNREIAVANTGEGISPRDLQHIFDRFYRADSSHNREVEGYGLGLSIAKNIVEQHRGKIRVSSEPDGETVFTVILPA